MGRAVWVVAQRSTIEATKRQPPTQGLKPQHYSHRQIVEAAEDYLAQHPELIAEAKETVLRWQTEAFLGKRAAPVFVMIQKYEFPVHPHMLRHSTRYKLANDGHDTRSLAHYLCTSAIDRALHSAG